MTPSETMERKMNKTALISAKILNEIANGKTTKDAIDSVLGSGSFDKLAGEVWAALRAKR